MFRRPHQLLAALCLPAIALTGPAARAAEEGVCAQPTYDVGNRAAPAHSEGGGIGDSLSLNQKIYVEADSVNMTRGGVSELMGGVKLRQGDKEFSADTLDYEDTSNIVTVNTDSVFSNRELIIKSRRSSFDLNANSGAFVDTDFVLPTRSARGTSDRVEVSSDGKAHLRNTRYTTCAPDSNAWYLAASDIKLDREEGLGTARNARLQFGGVPILYIPWFQFPIDDRRRTGLLFPTVGDSSKTGFDARWPVYLNLGPNYDATFTPREMSRRGTQLGLTGRYLLSESEGRMSYEYLDHDQVYGKDRSFGRFDHLGTFSDRLGVEATYAEVSDPRYFEDLGGTFGSSAITHLEQSARLTYQAPASYRVTALVQSFQTIDNGLVAVDDPYKRLPAVRLDALTRNSFWDTRAGIDAEFANFVRDDRSVEGQRIDLQPYLRYMHDETAWYITSQADYRYTGYKLTNVAAGQPQQPSRALPVISAETGLRFERMTGGGAIQTLEPRGFALYVPYEKQDDLPLFDTGEPDFDFVQLFARNRFYGDDRLADAKNIAGAVTTRLIDPQTGDTRWSASFGQLYRFEQARVDLPNSSAPERGATDFITELMVALPRNWSATATSQWSPKESEFERTNVGLRYRELDRGRRFDIAYRNRRGLLEQTDVSFALPVSQAWRLGARSRYSLRNDKTLESFFGAEYETCCWAVSAAYRRYIASSDGHLSNGFYLQLELKGLSSIGTGLAALFPHDDGDDDDGAAGLGFGNGLTNSGQLSRSKR